MRDIMCRAWLKNSHKMVDVDVIKSYKNQIIDEDGFIHKYGDYELMLFTGLYDKKGRHIFEGDIVSCLYKTRNYQVPRKYRIIWENCGFVLSPYNSAKYGPIVTPTQEAVDYLKAEVIGNIYDNPELIGENEDERDFI